MRAQELYLTSLYNPSGQEARSEAVGVIKEKENYRFFQALQNTSYHKSMLTSAGRFGLWKRHGKNQLIEFCQTTTLTLVIYYKFDPT